MNNKAVSPVIGVILMVAITVILAAAIGSSVFGQGTAEAAPQANFDIKAGAAGAIDTSTIIVEHLGGDDIHFEATGGSAAATKIVVVVGGTSYDIDATQASTNLGTMEVGDTKTLTLKGVTGSSVPAFTAGTTSANIKFIDTQTSQLVADKNVRF